MNASRRPRSADDRRVQRAAVRVAVTVAIGAVITVTAITLIAVAVIFGQSRVDDGPGRRGGHGDNRVIDLRDLLPLIVILGIIGVLILAILAWYVARRSTLPLADALRVQRAFVADASHEMRTPLTTLSSRIQLARHRAARGGDVDGALADLEKDAAVMNAVLTDLLHVAEAAGSRQDDAHARADLGASVSAAAEAMHLRALDAGVTVIVDAPQQLAVRADVTALTRAITALLDNAVRHSTPGSFVTVAAVSGGSRAEIRVSDQAGGIRGIEVDRLFERFVRAGSDTPQRGFGLGLSLVRDIANRFGGDVSVESTSSHGTTMLLELPLAD